MPSNLGSQFATLGGQTTSQKMLKVGPKFFQPWLLVYNWGGGHSNGVDTISKHLPSKCLQKKFSLEATNHMTQEDSCSFLSSLVRWSSELKAGCGMTCDGDLSTKYTIRFIWDWRKRHSLIHSSSGAGLFQAQSYTKFLRLSPKQPYQMATSYKDVELVNSSGTRPELVNPTLLLLISIHKLLNLTYEPCALNAEFGPTFTSLSSGYG